MIISKPRATSVIINTAGQLKSFDEPAPKNSQKKNIKNTIAIKLTINPPNLSIRYILNIYVYI